MQFVGFVFNMMPMSFRCNNYKFKNPGIQDFTFTRHLSKGFVIEINKTPEGNGGNFGKAEIFGSMFCSMRQNVYGIVPLCCCLYGVWCYTQSVETISPLDLRHMVS